MDHEVHRNTEIRPVALTGERGTDRNPEIMRSAEVARYIDMSDSWLRQTRMAGRTHGPPFVRQGRTIRYRRGDLDRWLEQRLCGGDDQPSPKSPAPSPSVPRSRPQRKPPRRGKGSSSRPRRNRIGEGDLRGAVRPNAEPAVSKSVECAVPASSGKAKGRSRPGNRSRPR